MAASRTRRPVPLVKPVEWPQLMVDVVLNAVKDGNNLPLIYKSEDEGKLETLKTLSFYEAAGEYVWPDFLIFGYDFAQTMKLRRVLVNDAFEGLVRNGFAFVGVGDEQIRTPSRWSRKQQRTNETTVLGKRRREIDLNSDVEDYALDDNGTNDPSWSSHRFLANAMRSLIKRLPHGSIYHAVIRQGIADNDYEKLADHIYEALLTCSGVGTREQPTTTTELSDTLDKTFQIVRVRLPRAIEAGFMKSEYVEHAVERHIESDSSGNDCSTEETSSTTSTSVSDTDV